MARPLVNGNRVGRAVDEISGVLPPLIERVYRKILVDRKIGQAYASLRAISLDTTGFPAPFSRFRKKSDFLTATKC